MSERFDREAVIGLVLATGVAIAALLVFVGGILYVAQHALQPVHYAVFHHEPQVFARLGDILSIHAFSSRRSLIQMGLVLLILLQAVRLAFCMWLFAAERHWLHFNLSLFLLILIVNGLLLHR